MKRKINLPLIIAFMFYCFITTPTFAVDTTYTYDESGNLISKITTEALDDDGDGLSNAHEIANGLDPNSNDSDTDGMQDGWEIMYGLDPLSNDANGDPDFDGVSNLAEYNAGTDPGSIQTDLVLANQTISPGNIKEYRATNSITSGPAYIAESGADVTFKAGNIVYLKPGFTASEGSIFHAKIE